jgi:hypothetical protein
MDDVEFRIVDVMHYPSALSTLKITTPCLPAGLLLFSWFFAVRQD